MADNYNILEPVTTPSGTTQRSIRAIEVSSQLYAAAVMHTASGTAIGHAEDTAHASDDGGVMALAVRRSTPLSSSGTAGDYSSLNVDDRGRLYVLPQAPLTLYLTSAAPTPSGTDILNESQGAIVGGDLAIRDLANHFIYIPFSGSGYTNCAISLGFGNSGSTGLGGTAFNQNTLLRLWGARTYNQPTHEFTGLITINASTAASLQFGSNNGGTAAYSTNPANITVNANGTWRYNIPEMNQPIPFIVLALAGSTTAPASGAFTLLVTRW